MNNEKSVSPLTDSSDKGKEKISLTSSRKWFWMGITVAIISPIAGIILAVAFWTEPDLKKQGRTIFIFSIFWGIAFLFLTNWAVEQGYLPTY